MGKVKYSPEMRAQTVKYIPEGGKSASKAAERIKRSAAFIFCFVSYFIRSSMLARRSS